MQINNRYDFVYFFYVRDGNPNGDPDSGNLPRVDIETGHGLVSDVCLKRKIRNYIGLRMGDVPPYEIYVKERAVLNNQNMRAYVSLGLECNNRPEKKVLETNISKAKEWMCKNFYDVRAFGAVMSTGINCGQVKGPIQIAFSRSIDPIVVMENTIIRCSAVTEKEAERMSNGGVMMARKATIPFAIYRCHGHISAHLAQQTGFDSDDLDLFWQALINMFDIDHSSARGEMGACALYVFKHDHILGNAPAHKLFELVKTAQSNTSPLRNITDCKFSIDTGAVPKDVVVQCLFG